MESKMESKMELKSVFNLKTKSGFTGSDSVKSAMQKYARRGMEEKMLQAVSELDSFSEFANSENVNVKRTSKAIRTNMINRLKVILFEDVSFYEIENFISVVEKINLWENGNRSDRNILSDIVSIISNSKKFRMPSYLRAYYGKGTECEITEEEFKIGIECEDEDCMEWIYHNDERALKMLKDYNFEGKDVILPLITNEWKRLKPTKSKPGSNERFIFVVIPWLWIMYDLKCQEKTNPENVMNVDEIYEMTNVEFDDYVFDVHTKAGKKMGKTVEDFRHEGSKVFNEDEILLEKFSEMKEFYINQKAEPKSEKKSKSVKSKVAKPKAEKPKVEKKPKAEKSKVEKKPKAEKPKVVKPKAEKPKVEKKPKSEKPKVVKPKAEKISKPKSTPRKKSESITSESMEIKNIDIDVNEIKLHLEGLCALKLPCGFVKINGIEKVIKPMNKSFNYGMDYMYVDKQKHLFGLKDLGMEIAKIPDKKLVIEKDGKTKNYLWKDDSEGQVIVIMDKIDVKDDLGKCKNLLKEEKHFMEMLKIRLFNGLFNTSDNILRNILVDKENNLFAIDENDMFGKRKTVFNKREPIKNSKYFTSENIESVIEMLNFEKHEEILISELEKYFSKSICESFSLELSNRIKNYKDIVFAELEF